MSGVANLGVPFEDLVEWFAILHGQGWREDPRGYIRNEEGYCPMCALALEIGINTKAEPERLFFAWPKQHADGLFFSSAAVICAADDPAHPRRGDLCFALGMQPEIRA